MSKTEQLQIRVSADQKARIRARAERAGEDVSKWVLRHLLPPAEDEFRRLSLALASASTQRPQVLAELHDFLARQSTTALTQAVAEPPAADLDPFEANYLAAMVEFACVAKGAAVPGWTRAIEPLPRPWFASQMKSLRIHLLSRSPPPFRSRNLFVDSTVGDRV